MKVAVFHMNQLGDMIFSLPLLYNLKKFDPSVEIVSIGKSAEILKSIAELSGLIDKVLIRPEVRKIFQKIAFIKKCKDEQFDVSIHISQSIDTTLIAYLSGIPERIGFETAVMSNLYTKKVQFEQPPSTFNNLRLLEVLNVPIVKKDYVGLIFVESDEDFFKKIGISKDDFVVCISPGTSKRRQYKMWQSEKFAEVMKYMVHKYEAKCFILGSKMDWDVCSEIFSKSHVSNVFNLAGGITLVEVAKLLKRTNVFIGVDSGLIHLAGALDTPLVGLYGKTLPEYIGPQNGKKVIVKKNTTEEITVNDVITAVEHLLSII